MNRGSFAADLKAPIGVTRLTSSGALRVERSPLHQWMPDP